MDERTVITIGREFGSGGHEIGMKLAEKLGISATTRNCLNLQLRRVDFVKNFSHLRTRSLLTVSFILS